MPHEPSRPTALRLRAMLLVLLCLPSPLARAAPAAAPADPPATASASHDDVDARTQDVLRDIERGPAAPATAPAPPEILNSSRPTPPPHPGTDADTGPASWQAWGSLLRLFAPALVMAAAVGVTCGVMGVFVLLRREALLALAMPQIVAAGAAVGMRFGWPTLPPAIVAAAAAMVYIAAAKRSQSANGALPSLYIAGLCLSFLIIANHGQDVEDLQHLFTGVDVAVSPARATAASPVLLFVGLACALLWRRWLLLAQAPAAAELAGVSPARWNLLFLALLITVLLLGTDSLGVVMVLAMLFLPAATVLPWARRIPAALLSAAGLALVFLAVGFYLSNRMSWPLSQSVGGVGFVALVVSHLAARLRR